MTEPSDTPVRGARLIQADLIGTAAFVVTAAAAAAFLRPSVQAPAAAVSGGLFVGGCLAFAWGFFIAVERSRTEAIELSSLFFLKESAPARVRSALLGLLAAQVVAAIVTASVRPFTSLAFGVLAPVWGLGMITLWSGRYGTFPPKRPEPRLRAGGSGTDETDESDEADAVVRRRSSGLRGAGQLPDNVATDEDRPE